MGSLIRGARCAGALVCAVVVGWCVTGCLLFPNALPTARMTAGPITGETPLVVHFDATTSSDTDGIVVAHTWTFGDGTRAAGQTVEHTFRSAGVYQVVLTVRDNDRAEHSATTEIVVEKPNLPPSASFAFSPLSPEPGAEVHFDASASSDPDGIIDAYLWDFGDGTTAGGASVDHAFATAGTYDVALEVTDDRSATRTATWRILVASGSIESTAVARFTPTMVTLEAGSNVRFDASSSTSSEDPITEYWWDFGEGTTGRGDLVEHRYETLGTYRVTLLVITSSGAKAQSTGTVSVIEKQDTPSTGESFSRLYHWTYGGQSRQLAVSIPSDLYSWAVAQSRDTWPYRDYDEYVLNPLDDALMESIAASLTLDCYDQTVNNALAFVQTCIRYQSDPGMFEYPRFPAETLVDEAGDCEDSAILYASIIRTLGYGALLVSVDTNDDGTADHMVVFVPVGDSYDVPSLWEYGGRLYALAETAVEGGTLPVGTDPWGLDPGDMQQAWDVARVDTSPRMVQRAPRP